MESTAVNKHDPNDRTEFEDKQGLALDEDPDQDDETPGQLYNLGQG